MLMGLLKQYVITGRTIHDNGNREYQRWKKLLLESCGHGAMEHILNIRKWVLGSRAVHDTFFMDSPNCWEFMGCDNGTPCPAMSDRGLHGTHGGDFAGRACWMVRGTVCGGAEQSAAEEKVKACLRCDFMRSVRQDEPGGDFRIMPEE